MPRGQGLKPLSPAEQWGLLCALHFSPFFPWWILICPPNIHLGQAGRSPRALFPSPLSPEQPPPVSRSGVGEGSE